MDHWLLRSFNFNDHHLHNKIQKSNQDVSSIDDHIDSCVVYTAKEILEQGLLFVNYTRGRIKRAKTKQNMERFKGHYRSKPTVIVQIWEDLQTLVLLFHLPWLVSSFSSLLCCCCYWCCCCHSHWFCLHWRCHHCRRLCLSSSFFLLTKAISRGLDWKWCQ